MDYPAWITVLVLALGNPIRIQAGERILPKEGREGQPITLPCVGVSSNNDVQWYKHPRIPVAIREVSGRIKVSPNSPWHNAGVTVDKEFSLHIPKLDFNRDNGTFVCEDGGEKTLVPLKVFLIDPSASRYSIHLEGQRVRNEDFINVTSGKQNSIICKSDSVSPECEFTWTLNGSPAAINSGRYGFVNINPQPSDQGSNLQCSARCGVHNNVRTAQSKLNVLYIDPSVTKTVFELEGGNISLESAVNGNPKPVYSWSKTESDAPEVLPGNSPAYLKASLQRNDTGIYVCTAKNEVGQEETTWHLTVEYPPDVVVTYNPALKALECQPEGMPDSYHFWPWEHRLGDPLVRTKAADWITGNINRLILSDKFEDAGLYVCKVGNSRGIKSGSYEYKAKTKPVFGESNGNGRFCEGTNRISVPFYSYPGWINVSWSPGGGEDLYVLRSYHEAVKPPADVKVTVYGTHTRILGQAAVIETAYPVNRELLLTVTNSLGSSTIRVRPCSGDKLGLTLSLAFGVGVPVVLTAVIVGGIWLWIVAKRKQKLGSTKPMVPSSPDEESIYEDMGPVPGTCNMASSLRKSQNPSPAQPGRSHLYPNVMNRAEFLSTISDSSE